MSSNNVSVNLSLCYNSKNEISKLFSVHCNTFIKYILIFNSFAVNNSFRPNYTTRGVDEYTDRGVEKFNELRVENFVKIN